jgi:hypothetical protein
MDENLNTGILSKLGLRGKILIPTIALLLGTIIALVVIASTSLKNAYDEALHAEEHGFDNTLKVAVEVMISSLRANHQRYLDGETTYEEA